MESRKLGITLGKVTTALILALLIGACSVPANKEIEEARLALSEAMQAGADTKAADEYGSAEALLGEANQLNDDGDYDAARAKAAEAKTAAVNARTAAEAAPAEEEGFGDLEDDGFGDLEGGDNFGDLEGGDDFDDFGDFGDEAEVADAGGDDFMEGIEGEALPAGPTPEQLAAQQAARQQQAEQEAAAARAAELERQRQAELDRQAAARAAAAAPVVGPRSSARAGAGAGNAPSHSVQYGENLWRIAGRPEVYNDNRMWPLIYWANEGRFGGTPDAIPAGTNLIIPRDYTQAELQRALRFCRDYGED